MDNNEKMTILKMLEQGKISAEEASKLLNACSGAGVSQESSKTNTNSYQKTNSKVYGHEGNSNNSNNTGGYNTSHRDFNDFASEIGKKFETFTKDMEPKIHKFTEVIAEKTTSVADKISKSFAESTPRTTARPVVSSMRPGNSVSYEYKITEGGNDLNLIGIKGDISIKGYNGDKLSGNIFYKLKRSGSSIKIMNLGNKYFADYNEDEFEIVSIDALIPDRLFKNIRVQTYSGNIIVENIMCDELFISNSNSNITVKNVNSQNIKIEGNNGKLSFNNINAVNASIENFNGDVESYDVDISNMKLESFNAKITMYISNFYRYDDYLWIIETSNAPLKLNLGNNSDLGYYIKAQTSLNNVRVGLGGLQFLNSRPDFIEAKSVNFEKAKKHIKLSLETSNAMLAVD